MLLITISVLSFLSITALSFYTIKAKRKFNDLNAKYTACQQFADESAKTILQAEEKRNALSKQVVVLVSKVAQLNSQLTKHEAPAAAEVVNKPTAKPNNKRPYNKRKSAKKVQ